MMSLHTEKPWVSLASVPALPLVNYVTLSKVLSLSESISTKAWKNNSVTFRGHR